MELIEILEVPHVVANLVIIAELELLDIDEL